MKIAEFMEIMEEIAPQSTAEKWDNPGLLAGDPERELRGVLLCVDATRKAVREAQASGANLILSHHPLLFRGLHTLREDTYEGQVLSSLLRMHIALFAAHTNLDRAPGGVNDCLLQALGMTAAQKEDYFALCDLSPCTTGALRLRAENRLGTRTLFYGREERRITRAAVSCGAGGGFAAQAAAAGAQIFLTGEMKHNERIEAQGLGMDVLLLGHAESERVVLEPLAKLLRQRLPVPVTVFAGESAQ